MTEDHKPPSPESLSARLAAARARQARADRRRSGKAGAQPSGMGLAFRISTELVAGFAVGAGIGLLLDSWLGTAPWLMILFFFLGAAAGMLNVYRTVAGYGLAVGYRKADDEGGAPGPGPQDDD